MQKFIGTKVIEAKPMTLGEYNIFRGWDIPKDEDPEKEGYLVEYPDSDGYQTWSPRGVFEASYFRIESDTSAEEPMLKFFGFEHLPEHLQKISKPFAMLVSQIVSIVPRNPERTVAIRKLLESKDCAVRAKL